jgi:hypothetical protein
LYVDPSFDSSFILEFLIDRSFDSSFILAFLIDRSFDSSFRLSVVMPQYQSLALVAKEKRGRGSQRTLAPGGVVIDNPTAAASDEELLAFQRKIGPSILDGTNFECDINPPIFRKLLQLGRLKKVPREILYLTKDQTSSDYDPSKARENYVRVSQCTDFVPMTDLSDGYHRQDDQGGGYRITRGWINFPVCYYASDDGVVIAVQIQQFTRDNAERHVHQGTADIIGKRTFEYGAPNNGGKKRTKAQYFGRVIRVKAAGRARHGYRIVGLSDESITDGASDKIPVISLVLGTFVSPRPFGFIGQHDGEQWDNSLHLVRWLSRSENNRKENRDPK